MKNYRVSISFAILILALAFSSAPAHGQAETLGAAIAAPIVVKTVDALKPKAKMGGEWLRAEVIHANAQAIIVREEANGMMIHTFTFAPDLKDKMQAIVDKGGYQYGDRVKILHQVGQSVALKISGKPSKPL